MRRLFFGPVLIMFGLLFSSAPALAFNHQITVYASVPMMRVIYVDQSGNITKVVGNTAQNITPQIYDQNNKPVAMTDHINSQYQQFLKDHNYKLEASKFYYLAVAVDTAPNAQTIQISTSPSALSLSL